MADISKITLPSGTTYDIKDAHARELIDAMSNYTDFLGVTTTALTDGATTNPITINEQSVTAKKGNIVTYGSAEFIFNGEAWQSFGDLSGLGSLAFKNSASASYTPAGSVSQPTFTGTAKYISAQVGTATKSMTGKYTPAGTVSQPTFTGTEGTVSVSGTIANSVTLSAQVSGATGRADVTPAGTVSQPTFTGTEKALSVSGTASGSVATTYNTTSTGANGNFTPAGTVSTPTISVKTAGSTTTIKNPTSKTVVTDMSVSAPAAGTATGELVYCSVTGETLALSKFVETTGASISTSNVTVKNGDAAYQSSQPSFTGTKVYAHHTFTGSSSISTGTFTPEGTVSQPTFSGTPKYVAASVGTASKSMTGTFTPAGTVSQPTFTGTEGNVSVSGTIANSVTLSTHEASGTGRADVTPAGTVSKPTFSGTAATITSS